MIDDTSLHASGGPGEGTRLIAYTLEHVDNARALAVAVDDDDTCIELLGKLDEFSTLIAKKTKTGPDTSDETETKDGAGTNDDMDYLFQNMQVEKEYAKKAQPVAIDLLQQCSKLAALKARSYDDEAVKKDESLGKFYEDAGDAQKTIDDLNDRRAECKGRGVLIICPDQRHVKQIVEILLRALPTVYRYQGTIEGIAELSTNGILRSGLKPSDVRARPGTVIVATNIAGRGTNFKTSKLCEENGGLHVVLAYIPDNQRIELQAWGRTGRSGNAGSGRFVVFSPDGATAAELVERRDEAEAERLEEIREQTLPKLTAEGDLLDKFQKCLKNMYIPNFKNYFSSKKAEAPFNALQQKSFMDHWALWLDDQTERLEKVYEDEAARTKSLLADFDKWFAETEKQALNRFEGYITSTGELIKLVALFMNHDEWGHGATVCDKIIAQDPNFAVFAHLNASMCKVGIDSKHSKQIAKDHLDKAIFMLERQSQQLSNQTSLIEAAQPFLFDERLGGGVPFFKSNRGNESSILCRLAWGAEVAIGQRLTADSFEQASFAEPEHAKKLFKLLIDNGFIIDESISKDMHVLFHLENPAAKFQKRAIETLLDGSILVELSKEERKQFDASITRVGSVRNPLTGKLVPVELPSKFSYFQQDLWDALEVARDIKARPALESANALLLSSAALMEALQPLITAQECYKFAKDYDEKKSLGLWTEDALDGRDGLKAALAEVKPCNDGRYFDVSDLMDNATADCFKQDEDTDEKKEQAMIAALEALIEKELVEKTERYIITEEICAALMKYQTQLSVTDISKVEALDLTPYVTMVPYRDQIIQMFKDIGGEPITVANLQAMSNSELGQSEFDVLRTMLGQPLCEWLGTNEELPNHKEIQDALAPIMKHEMLIESVLLSLFAKQEFEHSKGFTVDDLGNDLPNEDELKAIMSAERVLEMAHMDFPLVQKDPDRALEKLKKRLKDVITTTWCKNTFGAKGSSKDEVKRAEKCVEDAYSIIELVVGDLRRYKMVKPKLVHVQSQYDKGNGPPPEVFEFESRNTDYVPTFKKKRSWWPTWEEIVIALVGFAEIVAGALITVISVGTAAEVGTMLIGEGIADIITAVTAYIFDERISMSSWAAQKAISMAMGIICMGVGAVLKSIAKAAKLMKTVVKASTKASRMWTVTMQIGKEIAMEMAEAMIGIGVSFAADKFTGMLTDLVFATFENEFKKWVEESSAYQSRKAELEKELTEVYNKFGKKVGDTMLRDAQEVAQTKQGNQLQDIVESHLLEAAVDISEQLSTVTSGMDTNTSTRGSKQKMYSKASKIFADVVNTAAVIKPMKDIVDVVPEYLDLLIKSLRKIKESQEVNGEAEDVPDANYIISKENQIVTGIVKKIQEQVKESLMAPAIQSALERGASRVRRKVGGDTESAVADVNQRASEAQQNMRDYNNSNDSTQDQTTTQPTQDLANDIGLPDQNGNHNHRSPVTDAPTNSPSTEVTYNGTRTTLGDIEDQDVESGGMKLVPGKGNELTVVRPDYSTYVKSGFTPGKRNNRQELAAFAETSGLRIVVKNVSGQKIDSLPGRSDKKKKIEMLHVKDGEHPDGLYVMVRPGTMDPISLDISRDIKTGCGPQLVYAEARANGKTREEATALAKDPEETKKFLLRAKEVAGSSPHLKERYYGRKKEEEDDNEGGNKHKDEDENEHKTDDDEHKHDDDENEHKHNDDDEHKQDDDDENEHKTDEDENENENATDNSEDGNDGLTMREWFGEKVQERKEAAIQWALNAAVEPSTWDILAEALINDEEIEEEEEEEKEEEEGLTNEGEEEGEDGCISKSLT